MKRALLTSFAICLLAFPVMAETSTVVDAGVVDAGVQPADPVGVAGEVIDDAVKGVDEDPGATISQLIEFAKTGRWGPFAGLALMFAVWVFRKFFMKLIDTKILPWVTLGVAMVVSVGVGLAAGNIWWKVLLDGLITGGCAMAFWSALFKFFMKPKEKA